MTNQPPSPLERLIDRDAEQAVIGSILVNPDAMMDISDHLLPGDFYEDRARYVYGAALTLWREDRPIDYLTLSSQLQADQLLEKIGGAAYLTETMTNTPTAYNVGQYADTVSRLATLRGLVRVAGDIAKLAYNGDGNTSAVMDKARALVDGVTPMTSTDDVLLWLDSLERFVLGQVERNNAQVEVEQGLRKPPLQFPWKAFKPFDVRLRPGTLVLVIAGSGIGKTSFMACAAEWWAKNGHRVAFFHLELSHQFMLDRRMARLSGVPVSTLETGYLNGNTSDATRQMQSYPGGITYIHCPGWSARGITAKMRQLHSKGLCDIAIVDYLQKERLYMPRGFTMNDALADAAEVHKNGAEQMGIPVMIGSQVNRKAMDADRITSDHLRGSGEAPEKSNINITLNRELNDTQRADEDGTVYPAGSRSPVTSARVDKNTGGSTGDCTLWFEGPRFLFKDIQYEEER